MGWIALVLPLTLCGGVEQLVLNEVMSNPLSSGSQSGFSDTYMGTTRFVVSDWVEIYNPGPEDVPLTGLWLSDNCLRPQNWQIDSVAASLLAPGGTLQVGGCAAIWCPGYFRGDYPCATSPTGECEYEIPREMAPIKLSSEGEWIGLYKADGTLIDGFQIPALPAGRTYGSAPNGQKAVRGYLDGSTKGAANRPLAAIAPDIQVKSYRAVKGTPPAEAYSFVVDAGDPVRVRVGVTDVDDPDPTDTDNNIMSVTLYWRLSTTPPASALPIPMDQVMTLDPTETDPGLYEARIPGQASGKVVAFYIEARDVDGTIAKVYWSDAYSPDQDPKTWFQYPVGTVGASDAAIVINEVLADNLNVRAGGGSDPESTSALGGEDRGVDYSRQQADEWVELYNVGAAEVSLAGCDLYLTNNELYPTRFSLERAIGRNGNVVSGKLPGNTTMLVWCDGEPWQDDTVGVHADFGVTANEDQLLLFAYKDANGDGDPEVFIVKDLIAWGNLEAECGNKRWLGAQDPDWSLGRFPDGGVWGRMNPSPGLGWYPGAPNTGHVPALSVLGQQPEMARPGDAVKVMARAWDESGLPQLPGENPLAAGWSGVKLDYTTFTAPAVTGSVRMRDDGQEGDLIAGDGTYTVTLRNDLVGKVAYKVTAIDSNGNTVTFPRHTAIQNTFSIVPAPSGPVPVISEVVAANRGCECAKAPPVPTGCDRAGLDNFGDAEDWVEIYNPTQQAIYLGDYCLSDRLNWLSRWAFPAVTLGPGQRLVVWCDGELEQQVVPPGGDITPATYVHADFKLDAGGDDVYLVKAQDRPIVDFVRFGNQRSDVSSGRPEGSADFGMLLNATPGEPNTALAANVVSIVETQPVPAGSTITVTGKALAAAVKVFVVEPLSVRCDAVDSWDWANAVVASFTVSGSDLRVTLPAGLPAGIHRLCVLSETDPLLELGGLWHEAGLAWTSLEFASSEVADPPFRRGDVNVDAGVNIADAIKLLGHLFAHEPAPLCRDAADANDDGQLNIADAIKILGYLFTHGPMPDPGAINCGPDPTPDQFPECVYTKC